MPVDNAYILEGYSDDHKYLDLINKYDHSGDVKASDNGYVSETGYTNEWGNYVIINHQNGWKTIYAHLQNRSEYEFGNGVQKGDVIGTIGATGNINSNKLSFYIIHDGGVVDACKVDEFRSCEEVE